MRASSVDARDNITSILAIVIAGGTHSYLRGSKGVRWAVATSPSFSSFMLIAKIVKKTLFGSLVC